VRRTTGVFTLDVYGGTPEFDKNLEAGRLVGSEIQAALAATAAEQKSDYSDCLTTIKTKGSGEALSQAFEYQ
jgi:hypothetical protein